MQIKSMQSFTLFRPYASLKLLLTGCLPFFLTIPSIAGADTVFVQVQSSKLRRLPSQWAPGVTDLKFGDALITSANEGGWLKASINTQEGFVHSSAVTSRKIVLSSKQKTLADVAVDDSEVYLAGKGFNANIEKQHAKREQSADYSSVDRMQQNSKISERDLKTFIVEGELNQG